MKLFFTLIAASALLFSCRVSAPATDTDHAHRMAIRNIVDTFSILADTKEVDKQVLFFTENAVVEIFHSGKQSGTLTGRKQIGDAFSGFLNNFETVYHLNGQHIANIKGNTATATTYCWVILVGIEEGKKMKTTFGIYYNDDFVLENGHWLITKRRSNFQFQQKEEIK